MAINSYTTLKTAISNYIRRGTSLDAYIPDFIAMAESKLSRLFDNQQSENQQTGSLTNPLSFPTGINSVRSLSLLLGTGTGIDLEYVTPQVLAGYGTASGTPRFFTVQANQIYFYPQPDSGYTYYMYYDKQITPLSDTDTTNWLLTASPDVYLYGSLIEAAGMIPNEPRLPVWEARYSGLIKEIVAQDKELRYSTSPLAVRVI
jgi:hypothetical protein